ncbi:uncharacterized protein LOC131941966 [Physella acuta]|uniref:uncharacterized protein LOC131941966 n=1 Tax=Physella acuta TaxID=109671 RepID=UPI0027DD133D|nr:uncharacterized protein LOC131941966 [Physella acuta]
MTLGSVLRLVLVTLVVGHAMSSRNILQKLQTEVKSMARQIMLQQMGVEEKLRQDGGSGLKQIRLDLDGPELYYVTSHSGFSMNHIHDHSHTIRTLGVGAGQYVLNGVQFRTRHENFKLQMPGKTKLNGEVEDIPFPPVPHNVLEMPTVEQQIEELRLYFLAFSKSDTTIRDYTPYFKPVLCYLEGAWVTKTENLKPQLMEGDHGVDVETYYDLQERNRFNGHTGKVSPRENHPLLPTIISKISDFGSPKYGQWDYRILCNPIDDVPQYEGYIKRSLLQPLDDLSIRLPRNLPLFRYHMSPAARFSLQHPWDNKIKYFYLRDYIMQEIPGRDNQMVNINETSFGGVWFNGGYKTAEVLNVGKYHHRYMPVISKRIPMMGYSDPNAYFAETTQEDVVPVSLENQGVLTVKRNTWAIPLEIVYLTPLLSWNPYNITHIPDKDYVTRDGRHGGNTSTTAYDGYHDELFHLTPIEFFAGDDPNYAFAKRVGVLDSRGMLRNVTASGTRVFLPNIQDVGVIRTRFPIVPVHGEFSPPWKEINALKKIVKDMHKYGEFLYQKLIKP